VSVGRALRYVTVEISESVPNCNRETAAHVEVEHNLQMMICDADPEVNNTFAWASVYLPS
jgi:hypothetical protein